MTDNKSKLRQKLREKLVEKKIKRSNKSYKENVLDKTLKSMGIDKEKLKKDLDKINKKDILSLNMKK